MGHESSFGSIWAWLFGFVLLCSLLLLSRNRRRIYSVDLSKSNASNVNGENRLKKKTNNDADVIIVGAGVAGAALAHTLGKDGYRVHAIERDLSELDRIVGELLQPGGYLKLIELGLQDCLEGIDAQTVLGYAFFKDGKKAKLPYPLQKYGYLVSGKSFCNGRFIQKLRAKAATLSNVKLEEGTVTSLIEEKGAVKGVQYKNKTGQELKAFAPLTIVCDGGFSNLRRFLSTPKVEVPSHFVGLVLENCKLPYEHYAHAALADPSPVLFYPISGTEIRCLVDVPGPKLPSISNGEMANYLKTVIAPQIPPELVDAFIIAVDSAKIRTSPNRCMPAMPKPISGALLIGDALNMRHPITGAGMTVALSDIVVLRNLLRPLLELNDSPALYQYLESFYSLRKPVASTVNSVAGISYKVLCASSSSESRKQMRQTYFDYLSLGGFFSRGPASLLSGLKPQAWILLLHFFASAAFAVGRLLLPFPSPTRIWTAAKFILCSSGVIFHVIKTEGITHMLFPEEMPVIMN